MILPTPKILKLDVAGRPHSWLSIEDAISYYAKDMVMFELGTPVITYHGGINKLTNETSTITTNSIIGIKNCHLKENELKKPIKLTNEALFERDKHLCAYCGDVSPTSFLSREHIQPTCQNGQDVWKNVVTACKICNEKKGGRNLEQCGMSLLYYPYEPCRYESFILTQGVRKVLADQMDFLLTKIQKNSRFKTN